MFVINTEVNGVEQLVGKLGELKNVEQELADDLKSQPSAIVYAAQEYPPPIPTSRYVRTYNLERSIEQEVAVSSGEIDYTAYSTASYDQYVHGTQDGSYLGAWMHRGRWRTWLDIIERFGPVMVFRLQQRADDFIKRVMGS